MLTVFTLMAAVGLATLTYAVLARRQPRSLYGSSLDLGEPPRYNKVVSGWFAGWEARWNRTGGTTQRPKLPGIVMLVAPLGLAATLLALTNNPVAAVVVLFASVALPWKLLSSQSRKRAKALDAQLIPFLDEVRMGLATGTIENSIRRATLATEAPLRHELALLVEELDRGVPLTDALANMAHRNDSRSLTMTCATLDMAHRTGSPEVATNLHSVAHMLDSISGLQDEIASQTVQTRITAKVAIGLPIFTAAASLMLGLEPWFTPLGLGVGIFMVLVVLGLRALFKALGRWMTEATA